MKKRLLLILVAVLALGMLAGCTKKSETVAEESKFAGMWVAVASGLGEERIEIAETLEMAGQKAEESYYLELREDKTGTIVVSDIKNDLTWSEDGNVATLTIDGESREVVLQDNGELKLSFDEQTCLYYAKAENK